MKRLRSKLIGRTISIFFIILFVNSIFLPPYAYAVTGGPHQVEYTSYESPGATDMVNLLTGDFAYSLPVLDVPGTEMSFSLPLSYHAGIAVDQEASWVGLGWSMNAGSITRNINEFPDDADGEWQSITVQDFNAIKGWDTNLGFLNFGWNNQIGHYGSVNLFDLISVSWNNGINSVGLSGVMIGNVDDHFDEEMFIGSVMTAATWGAAAAAETATSVGMEIAKQAAIDAAIQMSTTAVVGSLMPNSPADGYWKPNHRRSKEKNNLWLSPLAYLASSHDKVWLNRTRKEDMFGTLYLGDAPKVTYTSSPVSVNFTDGGSPQTMYKFKKSSASINHGAASDMSFHIEDNKQYRESNSPAVLAYDDYRVNAMGISGSIAPYRLDIGSVSMPREMTSRHDRLVPVPYLNNYKVPFEYEGSAANRYFHHVGSTTSVTSSDTLNFGISHSFAGSTLTYTLNDVIFNSSRVSSDVATTYKIAQDNHVEWMTNQEIGSSTTYSSKFIDFLPSSERSDFRENSALGSTAVPTNYWYTTASFDTTFEVDQYVYNDLEEDDVVILKGTFYSSEQDLIDGVEGTHVEFSNITVDSKSTSGGNYYIQLSTHPLFSTYAGMYADASLTYYTTPQLSKAIGGYVITGEDGTNYHFALPVYDYDQRTEIEDATDEDKRTVIERGSPFANTWLLTAITSSDFIDRNNNGLADDGDWGGWVKLNYGKKTDDYEWRSPYSDFRLDPKDLTKSYTEGHKQLYYLNSIETRSHVALFLKSNRLDAKGKNSAFMMKLDEIYVLKKEQYKKLVLPAAQSGFDLPELSNTIDELCLTSDYTSTIRAYIDKYCVKKVVFNYTYDLCKNTPNSDHANAGKLTLTSISIRGVNDLKIVPDFKFEYGTNPDYGANKWDAWGLYNPNGTSAGDSHRASTSDIDATAWSLKRIITPLGSEIEINLERDTYSSISGEIVLGEQSHSFNNSGRSVTFQGEDTDLNDITITTNGEFTVGDEVYINGSTVYKCPGDPTPISGTIEGYFFITGLTTNTMTLNENYTEVECTSGQGNPILFSSIIGSIKKVEKHKKGGSLRVSSITMNDEFGIEKKIRYLYTNSDGSSSGVISKENEYASDTKFAFYDWQEYPNTPVMYGTVSVLNGKLADDNDFHTRTVYEFETPHKNLITQSDVVVYPETVIYTHLGLVEEYLEIDKHTIQSHAARIGRVNSIRVYDKSGVEKSSSLFEYTGDIVNEGGVTNYQGVYSQGTIKFDRVTDGVNNYHKASRTTVLRYPSALEKITTTNADYTSVSTNEVWDLNTGSVLQTLATSALGLKIRTVTVPAYKKYPELGPKAESLSNKQMLSQTAAVYAYLVDADTITGLLGAQVQTWRKNWDNYRVYNAGVYGDAAEGDQIWRKDSVYVWKGDLSRLRSDGSQTFSSSDEYDFTPGAANTGWKYIGQPVRYDHYSMPLETKDFNNIYSTVKLGYDGRLPLLRASNARYTEVAFSSAEDKIPSIAFFGGEVGLKDGSVLYKSKGEVSETHTGDAVVSLSSGQTFLYKPTGLDTGQTYRASVWTNSVDGRLYYKLNGGSQVLSNQPSAQKKVGNWYLLSMEIPIGSTFTSLEVGAKRITGTVLFDDFRFQPIDAVMTCYVYNPLDFEYPVSQSTFNTFEYVLDNDNLFTKYEFDERGLLRKTYRESIKYNGVKLVSETNSDYRRFHVNQ